MRRRRRGRREMRRGRISLPARLREPCKLLEMEGHSGLPCHSYNQVHSKFLSWPLPPSSLPGDMTTSLRVSVKMGLGRT